MSALLRMVLGMVTTAVPSLVPALGLLTNPWVLLTIVSVATGIFFYGLHIGNERLEAYQEAQEVIEKGRKAIIRYVTVQQKVIDHEVTNALKGKNAALSNDIAALHGRLSDLDKQLDISRSTVPPIAGGGEEADRVCFSRPKLLAGLRDALESLRIGLEQGLERGVRSLNAAEACASFVAKQQALTGALPPAEEQ